MSNSNTPSPSAAEKLVSIHKDPMGLWMVSVGKNVVYSTSDEESAREEQRFLLESTKEFLDSFRRGLLVGLAEEAERKQQECKQAGIGNYSIWAGTAAWLRAKAEEM